MKQILGDQSGYLRLTVSTITLFSVVFSVLIYQYFSSNPFQGIPDDLIETNTITSIQVFPQTLPVLEEIAYFVEVETDDGEVYELPEFFHKTQGEIRSGSGDLFEDGVINLPAEVTSIKTISLALFDGRDTRRPVFIEFLQGDVKGDRAVLEYPEVFTDETSASFSLATPTDNNSLLNERSGVWFGDVIRNTTYLNLPQLPNGWVYEGWAVINNQPLTTGRFFSGVRSDAFSGFSAELANAPDFPGEDFLQNPPVAVFPDLKFPVDLAGQKIRITIEPNGRNSMDPTGQSPFPAILFEGDVSSIAQAGVQYDMKRVQDAFPKTTIVLR